MAEARQRELAQWPGASATLARDGRHNIIRLAMHGRTALVTCSKSASCPRAIKNHVGDVRRALRNLAQPA